MVKTVSIALSIVLVLLWTTTWLYNTGILPEWTCFPLFATNAAIDIVLYLWVVSVWAKK